MLLFDNQNQKFKIFKKPSEIRGVNKIMAVAQVS